MSFHDFLSSDDEESCPPPGSTPKLQIDWLTLPSADTYSSSIGITALPGCRFRAIWRNLQEDILHIKDSDVKEVFVFCTRGELVKYRTPSLLAAYAEAGILVHHWPFTDGTAPAMDDLLHLLNDMQLIAQTGSKILIHCVGGLGRACLVAACLLLQLDSNMSPELTIERMRSLRGPGAVQTVKQYNFIHEFRQQRDEYLQVGSADRRPLSR